MPKQWPPPPARPEPTDLQRAQAAYDAIPEPRGLRTADGWVIVRLPHVTPRPRVGLIRPGGAEYAPVWAGVWHEALAAVLAGRPIRREWMAFVPIENDDDAEARR